MKIIMTGLGGFVATSVMLAVMSVMHRLKLANADMVRAIGSFYTQRYENSLLPGLIFHYSFGIVFAYIYTKLVDFAPVITPGSTVIITTFTGFVHGIIVGLSLEVFLAGYHPIEQFQKAGFATVIAHMVGHIAYGLALGVYIVLFWNQMAMNASQIH